mgnify:CR=1 FL=1
MNNDQPRKSTPASGDPRQDAPRWQSAYNAGTPTMLNGEDVKDFIDDVSTQLFIGTSYLAKVTDHEFENGTEITVPFD